MIDSLVYFYSVVKVVDLIFFVLKLESMKLIIQGFVEVEEVELDVFIEGEDGYDDEDEDGDI